MLRPLIGARLGWLALMLAGGCAEPTTPNAPLDATVNDVLEAGLDDSGLDDSGLEDGGQDGDSGAPRLDASLPATLVRWATCFPGLEVEDLDTTHTEDIVVGGSFRGRGIARDLRPPHAEDAPADSRRGCSRIARRIAAMACSPTMSRLTIVGPPA